MAKIVPYAIATIAFALSLGSTPAQSMPAMPCDVSFTAIPTFADMCVLDVQSRIYTITNNSPVSLTINYIRIINKGDGMPEEAATIIQSPSNNCGSSLAAGASCNIDISLNAFMLGQFNRVLQIGINSRQVELDSPAINPLVNCEFS